MVPFTVYSCYHVVVGTYINYNDRKRVASMRYLIKIILLLLALSFVGAGIPLYTDTIDLNLEISSDPVVQQSLDFDVLLNPMNSQQYEIVVEMNVSGLDDEELPHEEQPFELQLFSGDEASHHPVTDLLAASTSYETLEDGRVVFHSSVILAQEALDLPDGRYQLSVTPRNRQGQLMADAQEVSFTFISLVHYEPARYERASNESALRLFFPDESSRYLIPISRFVPQTNTTLRETVTQLEAGPAAALGLFNRSPIPPVPRIQLSGGTASLYLSSQLGFYNEYPNVARMAAFSLVESLGTIPEVLRIQFYFDNRIVPEGFRDLVTDQPFEPAAGPFVWIAYRTPNGRALLLPREVDNQLIAVPDLVRQLMLDGRPEYGMELQPTVPHEVNLLNYTLQEGVLILSFNQPFEDVFTENPLRGRLMLDSLILSMTSLDLVDAVQFQVEGRLPNVIIEPSLAEPWYAPPYMNPEL